MRRENDPTPLSDLLWPFLGGGGLEHWTSINGRLLRAALPADRVAVHVPHMSSISRHLVSSPPGEDKPFEGSRRDQSRLSKKHNVNQCLEQSRLDLFRAACTN